MDVGAVKDHLKRRALQTMIETYGQTPRKLFTTPHVQRFSKAAVSPLSEMIPSLPQAVENFVYSASNRDRATMKSVFQESQGKSSCYIALRLLFLPCCLNLI